MMSLWRHTSIMSVAVVREWVSVKVVEAVADGTGSVEVHTDRVAPAMPTTEVGGRVWVPHPSGALLTPYTLDMEREFHEIRLPLARRYGVLNHLNTIPVRGPADWVGIVATGHTYHETLEALRLLGLRSEQQLRDAGVRLFKLLMPVPLDREQVREFAHGLSEIIVIEEKAQNLEWLVKDSLFGRANAPVVVGKRADDESPLFPFTGTLDADIIATRLRSRLAPRLGERLAPPPPAPRQLIPLSVSRTPYFCSGCPHNTSTKVPEGSVAFGGIGCHTMAIFMDRHTLPPTQMGGEGANWIGMAPFTGLPHVFQNLGDGTYFHSGLLAIRAAVAAGVSITYKLLYNDAVAMTGGQRVEGGLTVADITLQLRAERVARIAVVSDDIEKYGSHPGFATGTTVHHRRDLERVQRELREVPGVSALIYDQVCAAEKRRRRKRRRMVDPDRRVVINTLLCEGCGDCSVQANCVSIEPVETEFGRKRRIEQSSCNKDYSCAEGLCPSFVSLSGGKLRRRAVQAEPLDATRLPAPPAAAAGRHSILVAGVGGTGVVTVGALLAMAAHIDGLEASVFDMTGLAQKGGSVYAHIKIGPQGSGPSAARVGPLEATLVLGCDLTVAASTDTLRTIRAGVTQVALNSHFLPTAYFHLQRDFDFQQDAQQDAIVAIAGAQAVCTLNATEASRALLGDTVGANTLLLGHALQRGWLPISVAALETAIRLNGSAVDLNLKALAYGRLSAVDPAAFARLSDSQRESVVSTPADADRRAQFLRQYQNEAYACRYRSLVDCVSARESAVVPGSTALTRAVEVSYFRLLAVKDEYEVARLLTSREFDAQIDSEFEGAPVRTYHLAPPLFAKRNPLTGRPEKKAFGPWLAPFLKGLARMKGMRGRWCDPFRLTADRRLDRALLEDYERTITDLLATLSPSAIPLAVEIASLPDQVRGYGQVRETAAQKMRERQAELLGQWRSRPG